MNLWGLRGRQDEVAAVRAEEGYVVLVPSPSCLISCAGLEASSVHGALLFLFFSSGGGYYFEMLSDLLHRPGCAIRHRAPEIG